MRPPARITRLLVRLLVVVGSEPALQPVLTHSKCVLLRKVAGGGLVVIGGELLECGDVPLLVPVNCVGMSLSVVASL